MALTQVDDRLITSSAIDLQISSGVITIPSSYSLARISVESGLSDDLDTINGGVDGQRIVLSAKNTLQTVVVKDNTGNIQCAGDFSLDSDMDTIELIYNADNSKWVEISRSNNL